MATEQDNFQDKQIDESKTQLKNLWTSSVQRRDMAVVISIFMMILGWLFFQDKEIERKMAEQDYRIEAIFSAEHKELENKIADGQTQSGEIKVQLSQIQTDLVWIRQKLLELSTK